MPICPHCSKEFSLKGLGTHIWRSHGEGQAFNPFATRDKPWNKGKTKESSKLIRKQAQSLSDAYQSGAVKPPVHSTEGLQSLSSHAKERGLGGYRPHPNRGQRYKGIWFDSKWEVQVAIILDEHKVKWGRPRKGFIWTDAGNKYYPDFYLPEHDLYLDPKNDFLIEKDRLKISEAQKRNGIKVFVLSGSQINWDHIQTLL